ncbi:hypothetical protein BX265_8195 [Streptomyces sp. TLI_235]|nr:hypothetical protein [Streptomyces sp. TLI_235]PBC67582.1 hypothetical protein BX265_8195 [Streptomyces sp. TLI_235]
MTTTTAAEPVTVRDFLFDPGRENPVDAIAGSLHEHDTVGSLVGGVRGLTASAGRAVEGEVAGMLDRFLGLELLDVAVGGWCRHAELRAAARRTRDTPGSEELVAMATHRISSTNSPSVALLLDGAQLGSVTMELSVKFALAGLVAVVREGRLEAVRSGHCTVAGTLTVDRHVVAQRQRMFDLPGAVELRHGVALLPPDERHAPAAAGEVPVGGTEAPTVAAGTPTAAGGRPAAPSEAPTVQRQAPMG